MKKSWVDICEPKITLVLTFQWGGGDARAFPRLPSVSCVGERRRQRGSCLSSPGGLLPRGNARRRGGHGNGWISATRYKWVKNCYCCTQFVLHGGAAKTCVYLYLILCEKSSKTSQAQQTVVSLSGKKNDSHIKFNLLSQQGVRWFRRCLLL